MDIENSIKQALDIRFELAIIDKTIDELNKLNNQIALQIVKKFKVIKTDKNKIVDDLILEIANNNTMIATNDLNLRKRLKEKNIKILVVRQKKYIQEI